MITRIFAAAAVAGLLALGSPAVAQQLLRPLGEIGEIGARLRVVGEVAREQWIWPAMRRPHRLWPTRVGVHV